MPPPQARVRQAESRPRPRHWPDLQQHLQGLRATQTEDFAMGAELFAKMLYATERVDTPLDELEAIGRADLEAQPGGTRRSLQGLRAWQDRIAKCVAQG